MLSGKIKTGGRGIYFVLLDGIGKARIEKIIIDELQEVFLICVSVAEPTVNCALRQ
jgi:hypothetical protein